TVDGCGIEHAVIGIAMQPQHIVVDGEVPARDVKPGRRGCGADADIAAVGDAHAVGEACVKIEPELIAASRALGSHTFAAVGPENAPVARLGGAVIGPRLIYTEEAAYHDGGEVGGAGLNRAVRKLHSPGC